MGRNLKIFIILALLVLLAPKLALLLASMSLVLIAIPIIAALIYFWPILWRIWQVRGQMKNTKEFYYNTNSKYTKKQQNNSNNSSVKADKADSETYIDLDEEDYYVVENKKQPFKDQ